MDSADATGLQATLFDFSIAELVRQHRESFQPLWTAESWVKLLIWLSLNCGSSGDEAGMARFLEALGPSLTTRMRLTGRAGSSSMLWWRFLAWRLQHESDRALQQSRLRLGGGCGA